MLTVIVNQNHGVTAARETKAREILQAHLDKAAATNAEVIERISTDVPRDRLAMSDELFFFSNENRVELRDLLRNESIGLLHRHALSQAATRSEVSIPARYIDDLTSQGSWGSELVAKNLNDLYRNSPKARYLLRSVNGEVRGFLSDRYRRLNTGPIVDAMVTEAAKHSAVMLSAHGLETKWRLRLLLPTLYEPIPGEVVAYGLSFGNSDFGDGALHIASFFLRVWCLNGAVGEDVFRQVHIGRKLSDDHFFSERTYRLDTATTVSAVRDLTKSVLSPEAVSKTMDFIAAAGKEEIDAKKAIDSLRRRSAITKSEANEIASAYNSADITDVPAGPTRWRFSNAVSLFARNRIAGGDERRGMELQELAGDLLRCAA